MARNNPAFNRREREMAKQQKAAEKRARRQGRTEDGAPGDGADASAAGGAPAVDQADVLRRLAELNAAYEAEELDFDSFDEQRAALLALIEVD